MGETWGIKPAPSDGGTEMGDGGTILMPVEQPNPAQERPFRSGCRSFGKKKKDVEKAVKPLEGVWFDPSTSCQDEKKKR